MSKPHCSADCAVGWDIRVLIDERTAVVDLIVDNHVQVLLGVVFGDLLEGEFLVGGHCDGSLET